MPKLSEAQFDARRNQILEATFRCLARQGYSRMTVRDIAREAGISVGTLYLYFKDKQEMVSALQQQTQLEDDARLQNNFPQTGPVETLDSIFEYLIVELDDSGNEETLRVDVQLWAESLHDDALRQLVRQVVDEKLHQLADLVRAAQADKKLPDTCQPEALARIMLAIMTGLELQGAMQPDVDFKSLLAPLRALLFGVPHNHL